MEGKRIAWVDVLKGLGIILVILQHCIGLTPDGVNNPLSVWILSFHMPLFFFASGILYKKKNWITYLAGKTRSLLLPVILFTGLNVILKEICTLVYMPKLYDFLNFAGFWFLFSLIYIEIIYYIVDLKSDGNKSLLFFLQILFFIVGLYYSNIVQGKEVYMATALVGYFFFSLGININEIIIKYKIDYWSIVIKFLFIIVLLGATIILSGYNVPVMMYSSTYGNSFLFFSCSILGCLGILVVSFTIKSNRILEFFGRNTLIILLTHFPVHRCCIKILTLLHINGSFRWILGFIIVCIIEILIVRVVNQHFPLLKGDFVFENN